MFAHFTFASLEINSILGSNLFHYTAIKKLYDTGLT
jgi:hypothetical protein